MGSDRAGLLEAPSLHPSPQALESRGSGLRDNSTPCSPQAQEFHQQMGGGVGRGEGFGLHPSQLPLDGELRLLLAPPPPKPRRLAPSPLFSPCLGWHGVCQALAENKPAGVGLQGAG